MTGIERRRSCFEGGGQKKTCPAKPVQVTAAALAVFLRRPQAEDQIGAGANLTMGLGGIVNTRGGDRSSGARFQ
jgi:hypothetical protein